MSGDNSKSPSSQIEEGIARLVNNPNARSKDARQTAIELVSLINSTSEAQDFELNVMDFWKSILASGASKIPWTDVGRQQLLLDLLSEIEKQPNPKAGGEGWSQLKTRWRCENLWSDLTLFGPATREFWNQMPTRDQPPKLKAIAKEDSVVSRGAKIEEWHNVNGFIARVSAAGFEDFCKYGLWALRDTIEPKHQSGTWVGDQLDDFLPDVAIWILVAGETLAGEVDKAKWETWTGRLEETSTQDGLTLETRNLARRAAEKARTMGS
jgi:hypothetical protein